MQLCKEGREEEAAAILFENNPFSAVTCQVCDWQRFCYGHCILNAKKIPIRWYEVEQELSESYLFRAHIQPGPDSGRSIAIVGAGPAGITAAMVMRQKGWAVTIYDPFPKIGGVLRYGIPRFRLDDKYIDQYARILEEAGVIFRGGVRIGHDVPLSKLRVENNAVLIAAGAWIPRKLDIPGEENPHVVYALDYLKDPDSYNLGKTVLVIGGGNVTMDASRTAARHGYDTTIVYRKTYENMPAGYNEIEGARQDGVSFRVFEVPVAIRTEGGKNIAVVSSCENYHREDGSIATRIIPGSEHEIPFDSMIVAISEQVDKAIPGGFAIEDMPDVEIAGDYRLGPATVVEAVESAKDAVNKILAKYESAQ